MRDAKEIKVERAIVHIVDHLKENGTILSEAELSLSSAPKLKEYLNNQVANALRDTKTSAAKFHSTSDASAASHCYDLLGDPKKFVFASRALAQLLAIAMGADKRVKPGSLAVCIYSADNFESDFLALIKIDPSETIVQKIEKDKDGKRRISLEVTEGAMPTAQEKLHKAALIKPRSSTGEYDLLLLDRQVANLADFFAKNFLNVEAILDARARTERLYIGLQNGYNRLTKQVQESQQVATEGKRSATEPLPYLEPEKAEVLQQQIELILQSKDVNIPEILDNLNFSDEAKQVIAEEVAGQLPVEQEFSIDPLYASEKLIKKKRFRGDYGVLFEIEADHWKEVVKEHTEIDLPGKRKGVRLTIEVSGLKWVKR
jgi:hypothetical protein